MVNLMLENKSPLNASDGAGLTALHHGESDRGIFIVVFRFLQGAGLTTM